MVTQFLCDGSRRRPNAALADYSRYSRATITGTRADWDHGLTDRAEQHSREPAAAAAADDEELGALGLGEEMAGGLIEDHHTAHGDIGMAFMPTGEPLGQSLFRRGLNRGLGSRRGSRAQ